ncbi:MAG: cell division protein FtsA [Roseburia sp.]|nr:cell division protein FtsA [Roseburia sp.]
MSETSVFDQSLVFGLDIGTRNVVGTVGYKDGDEFVVVAQYVVEHETRAMLDGQIHDIGRVGRTISRVKEELESQIGQELTEVCIAAAGRVLKTVTTNIQYDFPEETVVTGEDIHTLDLLGIEKAQTILKEMNDTRYKFYCVGYSVMKYFLNDEPFSSLESHKAERIAEDIIVTFLPEDVVDGLYAAVGMAGLSVANMTLEPIAAINVAIPENFRLLNIALVDIGAGTSDISVTRDGSIIAYGMIPLAGDEITELIVQNYLVDFKTAEYIKLTSGIADKVTYKDIMLIEHTIPSKDVWDLTEPVVDKMTTEVAEKIKELNGDKTVSAAFIVGGGGKIHGYTQMLAKKLDLPEERVALRGEEVLGEVTFLQTEIQKDPLLVTPIGICLNYYDQRNSFIMVRFNGERIKLYDNNKLTIVDAALQAGFPNEELFPKRGKELQFFVNGTSRIVRGELGESAEIFMNDRLVNINTPLEPNSDIVIEASTQGEPAVCTLEQLPEYSSSDMKFIVNGRIVRCPKYLEVNGSLELPSYEIQDGDQVETRSFYTVGQLAAFMDVEVDMDHEILVNNRVATMDSLIYENFTIDWTVLSFGAAAVDPSELPVATDFGAAAGAAAQAAEADVATAGESAAPSAVEILTGWERRRSEAREKQNALKEQEKKPGEMPDVPEDEAQAQEAEEGTDGQREGKTSGTSENKQGAADTGDVGENSVNMAAASGMSENKQGAADTGSAGEDSVNAAAGASAAASEKNAAAGNTVNIFINGQPVRLTGKKSYIFVDIFDFYEFDLKASAGRAVVTKRNGENAQFTAELCEGDQIELGWQEN